MEGLNPCEVYLAMLSNEVKSKIEALESYSKRPNANNGYIQKESEHIQSLVKANNGLELCFKQVGMFFPVAVALEQLTEKDPELGEVVVRIVLKPNNNNVGLIKYNPFENYD